MQGEHTETSLRIVSANVGSSIFNNPWELMILEPPLSRTHEEIETNRGVRELHCIDLVDLCTIDMTAFGPTAELMWRAILRAHPSVKSVMLDLDVIKYRLFSWGDRCLQGRPSPFYRKPGDPTYDCVANVEYIKSHMEDLGSPPYGIADVTIYALGVHILDALMAYIDERTYGDPCDAEYDEVHAALLVARKSPAEMLAQLVAEYDIALLQEVSPEFTSDSHAVFMSETGPQRTAILVNVRCPVEQVPFPHGTACRVGDTVFASVHGNPGMSVAILEWLRDTYGKVVVGIDTNLPELRPIEGYTYTLPHTTVRRTRSVFQTQRHKAGHITRTGSDRICYVGVRVTEDEMIGDWTTPGPNWPFDHNALACTITF